jgi:hypothetical protein
MRTWADTGALFAVGFGLAAAAGAAEAQQRQAGAHEHGRGTLNIALDGTRLTMELEAPGADIVGFEHKARTKKQKAAVEKAEEQLGAPLALFQLPAAAGCEFEASNVSLEGDEHGHEHGGDAKAKDHDHAHEAKGHGHGHDDAAGGEAEHSSFRAEYAYNCSVPANLTTIGFEYFKVFAGAQKLDVTVIGPKGQSRFEVSRAKPRLDLGGMM